MARHHRVEPSDAPWAAGSGAEFLALLAQALAQVALDLAWEGAAAHSCCVGLTDAQHRLQSSRWETRAGERSTGHAIGRGHVRIGPVIDIEHHAVRAFEQNTLAGFERRIHIGASIRQIWREPLAHSLHLLEQLAGLDRLGL